MAFRIYTKTGDKGTTSLIGGTKVPKSHLRIASYGTIDELNSFIGLLTDHLAVSAHHRQLADNLAAASQAAITGQASPPVVEELRRAIEQLREIQDRLFTIGASLATDPEKESKMKIPDLKEDDLTLLEKEIDRMDDLLPQMKSFILPGGHVAISTAHVCRCVCRRAERICVQLQEEQEYIEPIVIQYINRLSDYLFTLARYVGHLLEIAELPWKPRL